MYNHRRGKGEGKVSVVAGAALGAIIVGAAAPAQATVEFTPTIEVGATWTDNVELAPRLQSEQTEYVAEIMPGFELKQEGRRLRTSLDYSLRSFFYQKDSDRDASFHDANASLDAEVIPNLFFVEAQGGYKQQIIDPTRPVNNNFLFAVDNLTDTLTGSVTPRLRREFDLVRVDASYTAGFIDYKQAGDIASLTSDADTEEQRIALASPDEDRFISWGADYTRQATEFDDVQRMGVQRFEFERANGEIGIGLTDELRLIGRAGKETDVQESSSDGGLGESTWEAGFAYSPAPGTKFEAFYGKRFFGTSYRASARREAQLLQLSASYDEGPVTQAQQLLSQAQSGVQVTPIAPLDPGTDPIGTLTSDVFIAKNFDATVGLTGRLTKLNVSALNQRREYLMTGQRERVSGARAIVIRNLSARTDATLDLFVTDTMFRTGDQFNEKSLRLGLTRTLSERISANAMIGRVNRSGVFGYTANWINVGLKASF